MGAGHSHNHEDLDHVEVGARARTVLVVFLAVIGVLAVAGMIWLWPSGKELSTHIDRIPDAPNFSYQQGRITEVVEGCGNTNPSRVTCATATVELTSGPEAGQQVSVQLEGPPAQAGLRAGDDITVGRIAAEAGPLYHYTDASRLPFIIALAVLFIAVVAAVARWKGLFALLGLGFAGAVLIGFMLPALLAGKPGIAVALVGGTAIMFVVLYVAHGVSIRTSTALAGTLLGVAITTGLGALSVELARLSGFAEESDFDLASIATVLDFRELLMVAIIIGGLGVLNDVTITQSSAVWELRAAAPTMSRRKLFAAGMRIGRDHIASTIYTIVFAYAGSTLAVLLMLYYSTEPALLLINKEMFSSEIVRTLGSAIGLILSVPITTGIAALTVAGPKPDEEPAKHAAPA
ncbi:YibE/F family protein [Arachnia propionica]|nr:YibE/F family protein [Arachnia propionica]MDO5082846.1 YibE/F family protein [Arachnia propionica]